MCIDGERCSGPTHKWYLLVYSLCRPGAAFSSAYSTPCCIWPSRQRPSGGPAPPLPRPCVINRKYCCTQSKHVTPFHRVGARLVATVASAAHVKACHRPSARGCHTTCVSSVETPATRMPVRRAECVHCVLFVAVLQCFRVPLVRQLYWWWGIRPITRHSMRRLLHKGRCVVLVPGGVQVGGVSDTEY